MMSPRDEAESQVAALFAREVPEVASGLVELRALARTRGVRTKVAVAGSDPTIDPLAACIGPSAERIQRISAALNGERVDVLSWSESARQFIRRAMAPVTVIRVELDPAAHRARVLVPRHEYGRAMSEGGAMRDLASRLTGWQLDVESDSGAA